MTLRMILRESRRGGSAERSDSGPGWEEFQSTGTQDADHLFQSSREISTHSALPDDPNTESRDDSKVTDSK